IVEPRRHPMATTMNMLVDLLDLERIEENIFRGRSPDEDLQRVFGGQVAGQALVAAGRTVPPDRLGDALPAHPLLPPPPGGRGPARPGDLRPVGIVPGGRAGSGVPGGAHARGAGSRDGPGLAGPAQGVPPQGPGPLAAPPTGRDPLRRRPPWAAQADGGPRAPRTMVWLRAHGTLPDERVLHV